MPHEEQIVTRNQPDASSIEAILQLLVEAASPRDPRDELLESLFAQQDATNVSNRVTETQEPGSVRDFLALLGETALDFTPGVGDAKAVAVDAPEQFASGQNLAGIISILSAIPGVGIFGDLIRAGTRGAGGAAADVLRSTTGARADALRPLRGPGGVSQGAARSPSDDAFDRLITRLDEGGRGGGGTPPAPRSAPNPELEAIRSQIFQSLKRPDPFGDNAAQHEALIDQILELARRRGGG